MGKRKRRHSRNRQGDRPIVPSKRTDPPEHQTLVHQQFETISGPVPPPQILKGYGDVDPSFPQRILEMAENEQSHRHDMERETLDAQKDDLKRDRMEARLGQVFGLIIGLAAIVGGVVAAIMDAQWSGSIIGGGGVIGLVFVFIKGRHDASNPEEPRKQ